MKLYCCQCLTHVDARLTNGREIYPTRYSLARIPFWKCDTCRNYVGCHYKGDDKTKPLGSIPNRELRRARALIHQFLDPLWYGDKHRRRVLYSLISDQLGYDYHTGNINTIEEARKVWKIIQNIKRGFIYCTESDHVILDTELQNN